MRPKLSLNLSFLATDSITWLWRTVPIGTILAVKIIQQIRGGVLLAAAGVDLSLLAGWVAGWVIAEADHLFYATMCNPQELTCQRVRTEIDRKDWRRMWQILDETKSERTRLPIRNVLTGIVMMGVGLWVVTSSGSLLASGLVLGFGIKLFSEFVSDYDYGKWYWIFAREFSYSEHRGLILAWGAGLLWQWLTLLRG